MYSVRQARRGDLAFMQYLFYELNRFHHESMPGYYKTPEEVLKDKSLQAYVSKDSCFGFVGEYDGTPVGFAVGQVSELISPISKRIKMGSVDEIFVLPKHRGFGLGKMLLQSIETECRRLGASDLFVETWSFNESALKFYEDFGLLPHVYWSRKPLT